jgi:hemerythrin-like metal-binding protein
MAYLNWNPAHETGIAGIDYDHHRLVQTLNGIHDLIEHGAAPAAIGEALAEFHTVAAAHFALEERILQDERHPELGTRRRTHYQLLDEVRDIMEAHEAGAYQTPDILPATLRQWLSEAIDMDARLFAGMNDAGLRRWGLSRS